jgi:hypothetical protein
MKQNTTPSCHAIAAFEWPALRHSAERTARPLPEFPAFFDSRQLRHGFQSRRSREHRAADGSSFGVDPPRLLECIAVRIARAFGRERDFRPVGGGNTNRVLRVVAPPGGIYSRKAASAFFVPLTFAW